MRWMVFAGALMAISARALAGDVSVSVGISEPGLYGQINIGNVPPPPVIYAQPVVVQQAPEFVAAPPIYLHVPPGYEKHWSKHCAEYHACGRRVFFVRHDWYQNEYLPRARIEREHAIARHEEHEEHEHGHDRGHDHGE